jgi:eukaryotic-like serine/threonine-protein kinase
MYGVEDDQVAGRSGVAGSALRASDPTQLGPYKLLRRLGEGGMGSVYLAESADATPVALKVIRSDLVDEPEFRRRFRSEVLRAQSVPPFCTAEVLDADPDHETPYLVVEYVDGPSLAEVVTSRGPLTPSNLYGLAIGVATALTAIHGAGVIHRDLKPSNVLLAPGTPKVIDFGIARATESSTNETRTDQLMGTVAYMAPERLDPSVPGGLTPAADIFAWGAVVTYAATGHVPFPGETSPATAIAILTRKPNLDGVGEPLRRLVRRALAKRPEARPTARDLLDELLSSTPRRPLPDRAARSAASGGSPAGADAPAKVGGVTSAPDPIAAGDLAAMVRAAEANNESAAVTDPRDHLVGSDVGRRDAAAGTPSDATVAVDAARAETMAQGPPATRPAGAPAVPADAPTAGIAALTSGLALAYVDVFDPAADAAAAPTISAPTVTAPTLGGLGRPRPPSPVRPSTATSGHPGPPTWSAPGDRSYAGPPRRGPGGPARKSGWRTAGVVFLVLCVLASLGAIAGILSGYIKLPVDSASAGRPSLSPSASVDASPSSPTASASPSPSATPSRTSTATPSPNLPQFGYVAISDPLTSASADFPGGTSTRYSASCAFGDFGLSVVLSNLDTTRSFRCAGPSAQFRDFRVAVTTMLATSDSCGAIWFRLQDHQTYGYALRICSSRIELGTHIGATLNTFSTTKLAKPLDPGDPIRLAVAVSGSRLTVLRCGVTPSGCDQPQPLASVTNTRIRTAGPASIGIFEPSGADPAGLYQVTFADFEVMTTTPVPVNSPSTGSTGSIPPVSSPPSTQSSVPKP